MAALYLALALLAAMPYFLLVVDYLGATTAADKVALVVGNYASMYAMYLVTYVFFGIALGVLAFALYDRLQARAPATMRVATAIGLLWSVALVTSGMVFNYGMTTIVALAKTDPTQARLAWQAIEPVAQALGGAGGEILGGLWVLLVSVVALRSGALPKAPRLVRRRHRSGRPRLGRPAAARCRHRVRPAADRVVRVARRRSHDDEGNSGRGGPAERQRHQPGVGAVQQALPADAARARLMRALERG